MKVSAVGGAENVNIRTSRTVTLNVASLKDHPTKKAILRSAELLMPQLAGRRGFHSHAHSFMYTNR